MGLVNLLPEVKKNKGYQPDNWTVKHRTVVALDLQGFTHAEISEVTGLSESNMSKILADPRAAYDREHELAPLVEVGASMAQRFEDLSGRAIDVMTEIMDDAIKDEVRLKAATGLLDRAGYSPIRREIKLEAKIPIDPEVEKSMQRTLAESMGMSVSYDPNPQEIVIESSDQGSVNSPTEQV